MCTLYVMCLFFLPLAHFKSFSLLLQFSNFITCASVNFFVYSILGFWTFWICGFVVFIKVGTILTIIFFKCTSSPTFFFFLDTLFFPQVTGALFSFYLLCPLVWIVSVALSPSSLIFFFYSV